MNEVFLIGRLARDPELSYTQSQTARCVFTIAVDRPRRNGEEQGADFIRVVVWNKQAENCDRYLSKGRQVAVLGSIRTGSYENSSGTKVYTTDVFANRVEFLGGGQNTERTHEPRQEEPFTSVEDTFEGMPDSFSSAEDDIPF